MQWRNPLIMIKLPISYILTNDHKGIDSTPTASIRRVANYNFNAITYSHFLILGDP